MFKIGELWKIHFSMRDLGGALATVGLTPTVRIRRGAAASAASQGTLTEDTNQAGRWCYTFHSAEVADIDVVSLVATRAGYRDYEIAIYPVTATPEDVLTELEDVLEPLIEDDVLPLLEADIKVELEGGVLYKKWYISGEETLLMAKAMYDVDGGALESVDTVLAQTLTLA